MIEDFKFDNEIETFLRSVADDFSPSLNDGARAPVDEKDPLKFYFKDLENHNAKIIKIVKDKEIIALLIYVALEHNDGRYIFIDTVAVSEKYRNNGLSKSLYNEIVENCKDDKILFLTNIDNDAQMKNAKNFGFEFLFVTMYSNVDIENATEEEVGNAELHSVAYFLRDPSGDFFNLDKEEQISIIEDLFD